MDNQVLISTPCATSVLEYFGAFGVTWNKRTKKNVWLDTLRRAGYTVRSRRSQLTTKEQTVGAARSKLAEIANNDSTIKAFIVGVKGHVFIIDRAGRTLIDTASRLRDKRKIIKLYAVFHK